jgi:hypothetical protein
MHLVLRAIGVPIQNLIEYGEGRDSIDEFLNDLTAVTREQVVSFCWGKEIVLARALRRARHLYNWRELKRRGTETFAHFTRSIWSHV